MTAEAQPQAPTPSFCPYCGTPAQAGGRFCVSCGRPLPPYPQMPLPPPVPQPRQVSFRDLLSGMGSWGTLALFILVCLNIVLLIWAIGQVFPHMDRKVWLYVITPFILHLVELGGPLFFGYFLFLVAAIVLSFIWMVKKSIPLFGNELLLKSKGQKSPLYLIGTVFFAVFFFQIAYYALLSVIGLQTQTPGFEEMELWRVLFSFASASVWEEVVTRILLLGIPLLIFTPIVRSILRGSTKWRSPEIRPWWRYILGGGFKIGGLELFFLMFSSLMFGLAHMASWDFFKVLPAAVAGVAMGYLFLKEGLYASIMIHFFFDYLSIPLQVFPDNLLLTLTIGLLVYAFLAIGAIYFVYYSAKAIGYVIGVRFWPDKPFPPKPVNAQTHYAPYPPYPYPPGYQYPPQNPPQYQQQYQPAAPAPLPPQPASPAPSLPISKARQDPTAFGFVCRTCGNKEGNYIDGQIICSRCGAKN